jgi:hypothetical protein
MVHKDMHKIVLLTPERLSRQNASIGSFKLAMHSGYKLRVVTFGTKRRRSLGMSMERSGVKCFHCTQVFDLTNLKEKLANKR